MTLNDMLDLCNWDPWYDDDFTPSSWSTNFNFLLQINPRMFILQKHRDGLGSQDIVIYD